MAIKNQEALNERANNLEARGLNGFRQVLVTLHPDPNPTEAHLQVYFHNSIGLADILADPSDPKLIFPITGGYRVPAGPGTDQVKVISVSGNPSENYLILTVTPIGDYSTYKLNANYYQDSTTLFDPIFNEIDFKFRPGCFSIDCAPDWTPASKPGEDPTIDYLAKDYDSFRHTMIAAMMERVPNWEATSEADLDQVLIDLFSAAADELSDYQDRVMNEAYLGTARKRVSLARHARLMDYHIHQGNQASTWLALNLIDGEDLDLPAGFLIWTGDEFDDESSIVFMTRKQQYMSYSLNQMGLYTWSDTIIALAAGSTTADLKLISGGETEADTIRDLIHDGVITHLLIQERLNPATGGEAGRDPSKRQLLELLSGEQGAETVQDPLTEEWFVRVRWAEKDKLKTNYCFTVDCPDGKVEDVSFFNGNLVEIYHGLPVSSVFKAPGALLSGSQESYYEITERWGTICRLPEGRLSYKNTAPGGEVPPESTLEVEVESPGGGTVRWEEVSSLAHSDEDDNHFIVETDEMGNSLIRFGDGVNGRELPDGAKVYCTYQIGEGRDGNIGADILVSFNENSFPEIDSCWNPFDVTNGRDPEPVEEIIRRVPEAYLYRQLRAVTLQDYIDRAEELAEVSKASARYAWTGSWRTVQITIDPVGTETLDVKLLKKLARHLDAVRLIGEDLEIRPPRFVPLEIHVSICVLPDYWPEDVKLVLEQEFSDGFTTDGRLAFFNPDLWTFGQPLRESQIIGRVQSVKGVDYVRSVTMKRWNEATPGTDGIIEVRPNEIIHVKNDPDYMERGFIFFDDVKGGRQ